MIIPNTPEAATWDRPLEKTAEAEIKKCTPRGALLFWEGEIAGSTGKVNYLADH
jgi:hypothetical protein